MIGVNVSVPAPMAMFPFSGWADSFFGDLPMQGRAGVHFYIPAQSHDVALVRDRRRGHLEKITNG